MGKNPTLYPKLWSDYGQNQGAHLQLSAKTVQPWLLTDDEAVKQF